MSRERPEETARRYAAEVWEADEPFDESVLRTFLSPKLRRHMSATAPPLDMEGQIARLQGIKAAFGDLQITPIDFVADGDTVVARAIFHGTHRAQFEDGRIVEQWGGPDVFDMLRQIGAEWALPD